MSSKDSTEVNDSACALRYPVHLHLGDRTNILGKSHSKDFGF